MEGQARDGKARNRRAGKKGRRAPLTSNYIKIKSTLTPTRDAIRGGVFCIVIYTLYITRN